MSVWLVEREFLFPERSYAPASIPPSATKEEAEVKMRELELWPMYRVAEYRRVEPDPTPILRPGGRGE